jgi:hypothetical protein
MSIYQFVPDPNFPSWYWKAHKKSVPDNSYRVYLQGVPTYTWIGYKIRGGWREHGLGADLYYAARQHLGRKPRVAQMTGFLNETGRATLIREQVEAEFIEFLENEGFDIIVTPTLAAVTVGLQVTIRFHLKVPGAYLLRPLNPTVSKRYLRVCQHLIIHDPSFDLRDMRGMKTDSKGAIWVAWFNEKTMKGFTVSAAVLRKDGEQNLNQGLLHTIPNTPLTDPIEFYRRIRDEVIYTRKQI